MKLRLASKDTKRIPVGDEGDFLVVREDIDERGWNRILSSMPDDFDPEVGLKLGQQDDFAAVLFEIFVTDWSIEGVPATIESYHGLTGASATEVDGAVIDYFNSLTPTPEERKKSPRRSG